MTGEVVAAQSGARVLPFDLPEHLKGLESLIITLATEEAAMVAAYGGSSDPDLDSLYRGAASELDSTVRNYWALGQLATDPNSLVSKIFKNAPPPTSWNPWGREEEVKL